VITKTLSLVKAVDGGTPMCSLKPFTTATAKNEIDVRLTDGDANKIW